MAYKEELAERVRECLAGVAGIEEKAMFGGVAFMLNGNMSVGVNKDELMVRVGKDDHEEFVELTGASIMDFTGKPMRGWLVVGSEGTRADADLMAWVDRGTTYAASLPAK